MFPNVWNPTIILFRHLKKSNQTKPNQIKKQKKKIKQNKNPTKALDLKGRRKEEGRRETPNVALLNKLTKNKTSLSFKEEQNRIHFKTKTNTL
jgi:hypothetical protein